MPNSDGSDPCEIRRLALTHGAVSAATLYTRDIVSAYTTVSRESATARNPLRAVDTSRMCVISSAPRRGIRSAELRTPSIASRSDRLAADARGVRSGRNAHVADAVCEVDRARELHEPTGTQALPLSSGTRPRVASGAGAARERWRRDHGDGTEGLSSNRPRSREPGFSTRTKKPTPTTCPAMTYAMNAAIGGSESPSTRRSPFPARRCTR